MTHPYVVEECPTFTARIYIAGTMEEARPHLRAYVMKGGCVTIEKTEFIYTGGLEEGYVVGLINYPRFPSDPEKITQEALQLAGNLLAATYQRSCSVVCSDRTYFLRNPSYSFDLRS